MRQRALYRSGQRLRVQRKPFDVLTYLVAESPRLVSRQELLDRFFSTSVHDETLTRCISTVRKLLGDTDDPPRFIETQRSEGYRFVGQLASGPSESGAPPRSFGWLYRYPRRFAIAAVTVVLLLALVWYRHDARTPDSGLISRIAVLPIEVDDITDAWLGSAMTHHLMRAVSRIEGITVVAFSGPAPDYGETDIGTRLKVEAVLASRLERSDGTTVLSARLVATSDGRLLWSSRVDSADAPGDSVQVERLAQQVALRLRPMLQLQSLPQPVDPVAYQNYLQGRYYWSQRTSAALAASIDAFEAALEIEPGYNDARVGAAEAWLLMPLYGTMPPADAIPTARRLAEQVLTAESENARAMAVLGAAEMLYDWDWQQAEALFREAATLNPNDATVQQRLGELYCYRSRIDECRRQFAIARDLDPLSPVLAMQEGSMSLWAGDFERAVELYTAAVELHPEYAMAQYALGLAYAGLEEWDNAVNEYEAVLPALGIATVGGPMIFALARSGNRASAEALLRDLELLAESRYVPPSKLAIAHLGLGDRQRALDLFGTALEVRDDRLIYFGVDVHTRMLPQDPAFRDVARRLGF